MVRKICSTVVIVGLLQLDAMSLLALSQSATPTTRQLGAAAKAEIFKRGIGPQARVRIRLKDDRNVKGFVDERREDDFVLAQAGGLRTTIPYDSIATVKGPGLPLVAKVGIGIGVGAAAFLGFAFILFKTSCCP